MIRRSTITLLAAAAAATAFAAPAALDTSDIDTLLMQDMESSVKRLEPLIGAKDIVAATRAVGVLAEGLEYVEGYFTAKENAADAVQFARTGRQRAADVSASLDAGDFAAAAEAARGLAKACRTCHDAYRP
jgi:cytochrome c556